MLWSVLELVLQFEVIRHYFVFYEHIRLLEILKILKLYFSCLKYIDKIDFILESLEIEIMTLFSLSKVLLLFFRNSHVGSIIMNVTYFTY